MKLAVAAVQRFHARDLEIDFSVRGKFPHLIDAVLRGAEAVSVMHERELRCDGRQIDGPVERGIAATRDQDVLATECVHLAHGIVH